MRTFQIWVLVVVQVVLGPGGTLRAQEVRAELSSGETSVGEPVEFQITATGKTQGRLLDNLAVDGLEVASNSQQFQMQMGFPNMTPSVTTTWRMLLVPTREGQFSIPQVRVQIGNKVFKTPPSSLTVSGHSVNMPGGMPVLPAIPVPQSGLSNPQSQPGQQPTAPPDPGANRKPAFFGEMVVPTQSAFVGEFIPVDLRFYVDARLPRQFSERPIFAGEGFTVQRFAKPTEARGERDGIDYLCAVFRTAITAAKAGTLDIPPAKLDVRVQVPVSAPQGFDNFFGGMLQNFGVTDVKEIQIPTDPVRIEVKPLPKDGRPENFDGAIGDFKIAVEAAPAKTGSGEPVTLKVTVSGRGNFEGMGPPQLVDAEGWRVYDPSETFHPSPSDPIGFNGEKLYEFTLVAKQDQKATPPVRFSFFNPDSEKYVTLDGPPVAVDAAGSGQPAAPAATATQAPSPVATPVVPGDLSRRLGASTFRPAAWSPGFLITAGVLAALWLIGFVVAMIRRHANSPAAAAAARLHTIRGGLKAIASPETPDLEFLEGAARFLEARLGARPPDSLGLDAENLGVLETLLTKYEASKFSTSGVQRIPADTRREILAALRAVDAKAGKA